MKSFKKSTKIKKKVLDIYANVKFPNKLQIYILKTFTVITLDNYYSSTMCTSYSNVFLQFSQVNIEAISYFK
jgi:hypothetical protein